VAGGIAHEVNNGLLVLQGNLELLEEPREEDGPSGTPGVEAMRAAIRSLHGLGDRLLAATGQQRLDPVEVELPAVLQAALDRASGANGHPPALELEPGLPPVRVDPVRFGAVLDAVLANAREAAGRDLTLRARRVVLGKDEADSLELAPGAYLRLSVLDRGPGFVPDALERGMEPFFTTSPGAPARGLGLTMVRAFTRQSGGAVRLRNRARGGAAVDLWLPLA
jgi:signal transduction histidine kinase